MVFQQKLLEKSILHCQNDWSDYGPADQFWLLESALRESVHLKNREIKIHIYRKRQTSDSSWEFLRIENSQIKTVPNDSYG